MTSWILQAELASFATSRVMHSMTYGNYALPWVLRWRFFDVALFEQINPVGLPHGTFGSLLSSTDMDRSAEEDSNQQVASLPRPKPNAAYCGLGNRANIA
jgi:hypothetical protein